jgi:lipid-A-disaccharide synthase-like uncharacterized protein
VILLVSFLEAAALDPLDVLPLALAAFVTFALFSVEWLVQFFAGSKQRSKSQKSF